MSPPLEAPSRRAALRELSAISELPRLVLTAPQLVRLPRGEQAPVLVLPGFGAGDTSTWLLRSYLRSLGYAATGWGIGRNRGDVPGLVRRMIARTDEIARSTARPVRLVGWSLGGVIAREIARERSGLVERIITLGSPVVGGPKYTLAAAFYRRQGVDLDALEREIAARDRTPIRVPITAIYSRNDGVVAWRACIDHSSPAVEHVEVRATHTGLGFSAEVYAVLADRLAIGLGSRAA